MTTLDDYKREHNAVEKGMRLMGWTARAEGEIPDPREQAATAELVVDLLAQAVESCPYSPDCDISEEAVDFYTNGPWGPTKTVCLAHPAPPPPEPDPTPVACAVDLRPGDLCSVCWTTHESNR